MTAFAAGYSKIRRMGLASRFVVFVALFAFSLQSYISQTHIQSAAESFGIIKIADTQSSAPGKTPLDNRPADCPFCQTVAFAGAFVISVPLLFHIPVMGAERVTSPVAVHAIPIAATRNWRSRAPPQV